MVESLSDRRMAENEVIFRGSNKRLRDGIDELNKTAIEEGEPEIYIDHTMLLYFYCECSNENCRVRIKLSLDEYNDIHKRNDTFAIACGHEVERIEDVTYSSPEYCVVKKHEQPPQSVKTLNRTPVNN